MGAMAAIDSFGYAVPTRFYGDRSNASLDHASVGCLILGTRLDDCRNPLGKRPGKLLSNSLAFQFDLRATIAISKR